MAVVQALRGAISDFFEHGCGTLAASLAFFAILSLFPMVFLVLQAIGFFFSQESIGHEYVLTFFEGFFPSIAAEFAQEIERVSREHVVQWVVLLTFIWFGSLVFYEVEYASHVVFRTKSTRNPIRSTIRSVTLLGLVAVLLIASFLATQIVNMLVAFAPKGGNFQVAVGAVERFLLSYALPFLSLLTSSTCLYRYLPQNRPRWRDALVGGLFLALLWELAKHLFSTYVQNLSIYGRMYGSLLAIVLCLIWIYYSAALFLFCATLVHRLHLQASALVVLPPLPVPASESRASTPLNVERTTSPRHVGSSPKRKKVSGSPPR